MKSLKKYVLLVRLSFVGSFLSSVSLFLIPFADINGQGIQKAFAYVAAAVFWSGFILEIIFVFASSCDRKKIEKKRVDAGGEPSKKTGVGAITFFSNRLAAAADSIFIVTAIAVAVLSVLKVKNNIIVMFVTAIMFFSLNMHCILNGRNYRYYANARKFLKKQGAKKDE